MNLHQWALHWGVPQAALEDLLRQFGAFHTDGLAAEGLSEAAIQSVIRLEATQKGKRLFRNNVGAGMLENGSFLRWGLANDTAAVNAHCKSSDLIGISGELITPADVGQRRGRFVARETKRAAWRWCGDEHEQAQLRFLELIASYGGDAAFAQGEGTL